MYATNLTFFLCTFASRVLCHVFYAAIICSNCITLNCHWS